MTKPNHAMTLILAVVSFALLSACTTREPETTSEKRSHPDATYRGAFIDEGMIQVNLQFTLVDGVVTEASFRHLVGTNPEYSLENQQEPYRSVVAQYEEALQHLVGKPLRDHLGDLYDPGRIVTLEVDGYTGATIRSTKIISAVRDALNRGPYQF